MSFRTKVGSMPQVDNHQPDPVQCAELAARHIDDPLTKARVLAEIAVRRKKDASDLLEEAVCTLRSSGSKLSRSLGLAAVAAAYASLGKQEIAGELFAQAIDIGRRISNPSTKATAILGISEAYGRADLRDAQLGARDLVDEAHFKDLIAYGAAGQYLEAGRLKEAVAVCELLSDNSMKFKILALVALKVEAVDNKEEIIGRVVAFLRGVERKAHQE